MSEVAQVAYRYALAFYLIFAAYFFYLFEALGKFVGQHYIPEGAIYSVTNPRFNMTNYVVAGLLTVVCTAILFAHERLKEYIVDVGDEMTRISWEDVGKTQKNTVIVIGLVLVTALYLFLADMVFLKILNATLSTAA